MKRMYKASLILQGEGRSEHWTCLLTMKGTGYGGQGQTLADALRDLAKNVDARKSLEQRRATVSEKASSRR